MSPARIPKQELEEMVWELGAGLSMPEDDPSERYSRIARELLIHQVELETQNEQLRMTQLALEESRDRYSDLYDFAPVAYYTFDLRGCIQEMNLTGAGLLGRERLRFIGQPFLPLAQVEPPSAFWDHIRRTVQARSAVTSEWTLSVRGRVIHVQAISSPVFDREGEVYALRTSLSDISACKRAEAERNLAWRSERALREQLDRVDQAMCAISESLAQSSAGSMSNLLQVIVDQAREIVCAEYAAFGLAGPARKAFGSWTFSGGSAAQALAQGREPRAVSRLDEGELPSLRLEGLTDDPACEGFPAQHLAVRGLVAVSVTYGGQLLGNLFVADKIGGAEFSAEDQRSAELLAGRIGSALEIARLQDEATAAIQARDRLLAIVSHDLRNPLSVIALNATLLLREPGARHDEDGPAQLIKRSTVRMASLIQDLLDAATIEAGAFTIEPRPVNPQQLLRDYAELQRPIVAEQGIRLELADAPALPAAFCDAERVLQVLGNLVGNAAKFTPEGGVIRLSVCVHGEQLCFSVGDSGCGIAPADLPKLFDRYWKGKPGARQGTGLGLSIAQGIVHAHGGSIWVESEVGGGTTVSFLLPLALAPAESSAPDAPVQFIEPGLDGLRVLLVDDEEGAIKALSAILRSEGLSCTATTSAQDALRLFGQEPPDLLVLDMEMPEMNGLALLRRARERHASLPAIVMSGYSVEHADVKAALAEGDVGYLPKPIDVDQLLELIAMTHRGAAVRRPQ